MKDYERIAKYIKPDNAHPVFADTHYSITHVQKQYKDIYNLDIQKVWGYKYYRNRRFIEYNVFDESGKCVMAHVTLRALAELLVSKGEY